MRRGRDLILWSPTVDEVGWQVSKSGHHGHSINKSSNVYFGPGRARIMKLAVLAGYFSIRLVKPSHPTRKLLIRAFRTLNWTVKGAPTLGELIKVLGGELAELRRLDFNDILQTSCTRRTSSGHVHIAKQVNAVDIMLNSWDRLEPSSRSTIPLIVDTLYDFAPNNTRRIPAKHVAYVSVNHTCFISLSPGNRVPICG